MIEHAIHTNAAGLPEETEEEVRDKRLREIIFEEVRQEVLPAAPSRLDCTFLWLGSCCAEEFRDNYGEQPAYIFEIELQGDDAPWVFDFHLYDEGETEAEIREAAHLYWSNEDSDSDEFEVLTTGAAIVGQLVSASEGLHIPTRQERRKLERQAAKHKGSVRMILDLRRDQ